MKKYLFGILAIALAIGFSAFTVKKDAKVFVDTPVYYDNGAGDGPNQYIPSGVTSIPEDGDARDLSMTSSSFKDVNHWSTSSNGVTATSGNYINRIEFPLDNASDGTADGLLSVAEATAELYALGLPVHGGYVEYRNTNPAIKIYFFQAAVKH